MPPQFLAIGHVTQDRLEGGIRWGGAATYAAQTAQRLGWAAAVVTAGAFREAELRETLPGVAIHYKPSPATTTFANRYQGGRRQQWLLARAEALEPQDIPQPWRQAPLVLLCPLAWEFSPTLARCFPNSFVGASLQGWLRAWDASGQVSPQPWWDEEGILGEIHAALLSREDAGGNESLIAFYASRASRLVVTEGEAGARLWDQGRWAFIPAFLTEAQDPTGAGDAFAAAFLIALHEGQGALEAARFASCLASFVVEGTGLSTIPTRSQVEARLHGARLPLG